MNRALYVAKTGLEAQQFRLAAISNNLANANTYGFKAGRAEFDDLLYQNVRMPGRRRVKTRLIPCPRVCSWVWVLKQWVCKKFIPRVI